MAPTQMTVTTYGKAEIWKWGRKIHKYIKRYCRQFGIGSVHEIMVNPTKPNEIAWKKLSEDKSYVKAIFFKK